MVELGRLFIWKTRAIHALAIVLVVAFCIWPFVHRWLCVQLLVDPWKLGGFAMYTVFDTADFANVWGDTDPLSPALYLNDQEQNALQEWIYLAQHLGLLHPPHALGALLLENRPELQIIVTRQIRVELHPETAVTFSREITYHTTRTADGYQTQLVDVTPPVGEWGESVPLH